jgi:hypothetical protein
VANGDCGPTPGAHRIAAGGNRSPRRLQVGICFQPRLRARSRAFTGAVSDSGQLHQLSPRLSDSTASDRRRPARPGGAEVGYSRRPSITLKRLRRSGAVFTGVIGCIPVRHLFGRQWSRPGQQYPAPSLASSAALRERGRDCSARHTTRRRQDHRCDRTFV